MTEISSEEKKRKKKTEKKKSEKVETPISFDELITSLQGLEDDTAKAFDKSYALYEKIKLLPKLEKEKVIQFFELVRTKVGDNWVQFLTKASLELNPAKRGNDGQIVSYIVGECMRVAEEHGLSTDVLMNAEEEFFRTKDSLVISTLLSKSVVIKDEAGNSMPPHIIASLVFIPFSLNCRQRGFENYKTQIIIDRVITEFLTADSKFDKDDAGSTLGALLSSKIVSIKKISELKFLYSGTTEKVAALETQISELKATRDLLSERCASLSNKLEMREQTNSELKQQIENLELQNKELEKSRDDARAMLKFETHKFENLIKTREEGIAERLYSSIALELEAIQELCGYLGENDQKRIMRRLDRISSILLRNKGKQNG